MQQLSFHLQQHFISAPNFKAITATIFIAKQFLFLSNKIFELVATCNFRPIIKNLRQPLNLEQKILKHAATLKSETKTIKTCGNLGAAV